jgi:hypothetical protein
MRALSNSPASIRINARSYKMASSCERVCPAAIMAAVIAINMARVGMNMVPMDITMGIALESPFVIPPTKRAVSLNAGNAGRGLPFTVYRDLLNQRSLSHRREFGFFLTVRRSKVPELLTGIDLRRWIGFTLAEIREFLSLRVDKHQSGADSKNRRIEDYRHGSQNPHP